MKTALAAGVLFLTGSVPLPAPCSLPPAAGILLPAPSSPQQATLDREIKAAVASYVDAVNARDTRRVADLYMRDSGVSTLGDGSIVRGWGAVRETYAAVLSQVQAFHMEIPGDTVVVALGRDAALAYFPYLWRIEFGGRAQVQRGAMSLVYRRTADGWRIAQDHTSSTTPALGPAAPGPAGDSAEGAPAAPRRRTENCVVTRIVDGDTLDCARGGRVRLIGIDTPERDQRPFGGQAAAALRALVPVGSRVQLERDVTAADRYGRRLAYVWVEGTLVNWALVRNGFAVVYTVPPDVQWERELLLAQKAARRDAAGFWATGGFACEPAQHRRGAC